jgi:SPP1 gp7 family putative phage head morphogenesis protein
VAILDPRRIDFWDDEERQLWDTLAPTVLRVHLAGAIGGIAMLPKGFQNLLNWDVYNQNAIDWLNNYRITTVDGINATTYKQVTRAIEDWIKGGEHLDTLTARLEPVFGQPRATRIAVTEVTRVYNEGNRTAWKATGFIGGNKWNTVNDERVCLICEPLDGVEVGLDEGFTPDGPGEGPLGPPAHISCRCFTTPVLDMDMVGNSFDEILNGE